MKKIVRLTLVSIIGISVLTSCHNDVKDVAVSQEELLTETELREKELGVTFFKKDIVLKDASGLNEVSLRISSPSKAAVERYLNTYDLTLQIGRPKVNKVQNSETNLKSNQSTDQSDKNSVAESEKVLVEITSQKIQNPSDGFGLNVKVKEVVVDAISKGARTQAYTTYSEYTSPENPNGVFVSTPGDFNPNNPMTNTRRYIDAAIELRRTRLTSFQRAYFQIKYNTFPGNIYVLAGSDGNINTNPVFEWLTLGDWDSVIYEFTGNSYRRAMLKVHYTPRSSSDNGFGFSWSN